MLYISILNNKFDLIQTKTVSHNLLNSVEHHLIQLNSIHHFVKYFLTLYGLLHFTQFCLRKMKAPGKLT
jgi:hypothetical protein